MRLVTTGRPDAQGRLQGALDIELKPGWKTYWRDPGDNGVPPQLGIDGSTNVTGAEMSFPAPRRHDDGYGQWAGYDHSVSLPILFTLAAPQSQTKIDARIFIGICETICIPVQAKLEVDPGTDPDNGADAQAVEAALAALPPEAHPGFRAAATTRRWWCRRPCRATPARPTSSSPGPTTTRSARRFAAKGPAS